MVQPRNNEDNYNAKNGCKLATEGKQIQCVLHIAVRQHVKLERSNVNDLAGDDALNQLT